MKNKLFSGHKTIRTGPLPGDVRHEPLTEADVKELLAEAELEKSARAIDMPTADDAIKQINRAYLRLKELGWRDPPRMMPPNKVLRCLMVEGGCSRIIEGGGNSYSDGKIFYTTEEAGDIWPAHPLLILPLDTCTRGRQ